MDPIKQEQIRIWKERPYSWSQHSSFIYSHEQWYSKYILGEISATSPEMEFGKFIGGKLEKDPAFLPQIKRNNVMEHEFKCMFGKIPLVGYADSFCTFTNKLLEEYKTGVKKWDQKRVDDHGQLTMYLLMHYIITKTRPEDVLITLWWMPTKRIENGDFTIKINFIEPIEENIKSFSTKRTTKDILKFGALINKTYKEMEMYAITHA